MELNQFFTNSSFTQLKLSGCVVLNLTGAISWNKLTSLYIRGAKLNDDLIHNIITGSPLLETLHLQYCYGFRRIDITSKSVKNLLLDGPSYIFTNNIIKINAPDILSLTIEYTLYTSKLCLLNVSSLVEAKLNYLKIAIVGQNNMNKWKKRL